MPKRVPHLDKRLNRNRGVLHQIVVEPTQCQRDRISSINRQNALDESLREEHDDGASTVGKVPELFAAFHCLAFPSSLGPRNRSDLRTAWSEPIDPVHAR